MLIKVLKNICAEIPFDKSFQSLSAFTYDSSNSTIPPTGYYHVLNTKVNLDF